MTVNRWNWTEITFGSFPDDVGVSGSSQQESVGTEINTKCRLGVLIRANTALGVASVF